MDSNFNIITLVHAIGIIQGFILGTILLFIHRNQKSTLFLGLFLIGFAVEFLPTLLSDLNILEHTPELLLLPINFAWILFPLFFIYVQKISIFSKEKITYWVLYPGILSILIQVILFFLPENTKQYLNETFFFEAFFVLGLIYSFYIVVRINRYVHKHIKEVRNQFASDKNKQLQWTQFFVTFCFALVAVRIGTLFIDTSPYLHLILSCFNLIVVFSVAICGIIQYNVFSAIKDSDISEKHRKSSAVVPEQKLIKLIDRLDNYILDSGVFAKQELTIADVSSVLDEHPRLISVAINKHHKKNFNSYINEFRINKAKELLTTNLLDNLSIEGLSYEAGFHSKSSFYSAFKKATGTTPIQYKKNTQTR